MPLLLMSPAIPPGGEIGKEYTCDGSDISPPVRWSGVPSGAASLVLAVEDPDAPGGTFQHWAVYDIPPATSGLAAGDKTRQLTVWREARNDFGRIGYGGPCPPPGGGVHHYHFELMALSRASLGIAAGATVGQVLQIAAPYVIARVEFVGTYQR